MTQIEGTPRLIGLRLLIIACLVGMCVVVFSRIASMQFVAFDDDIELTTNPHIQQLDAESLKWMFTNTSRTERYIPMSWIVWALIYHFWQLNPTPYHMEAIGVHIINTVLVFVLVESLLRRYVQSRATWQIVVCSGIGAALWAIHPLRVEVVAWATQVRFAEAACFFFIALLFYLSAVDKASTSPIKTVRFWASVASFGVSLLFYPSTIGLPIILLLLDVFLLKRRGFLKLIMEKLPYCLPALLVGIITIYGRINTNYLIAPATFSEFDLTHRVMQVVYIFIYYLWKPFSVTHVTPVYTELENFNPFALPFMLSLLSFVAISIAAFVYRKRYPILLLLWCAHLALIFPVGGYFDHPHYTCDRYGYVDAVLWSCVIAYLLVRVLRWGVLIIRLGTMLLCGGIIFALCNLSRAQTLIWRDSGTLFSFLLDDLKDDPFVFEVHHRLAQVYLEHNDIADALDEVNKTLAVLPYHVPSLIEKGFILRHSAEIARAKHEPLDVVDKLYFQAAVCFDSAAYIRRTTGAVNPVVLTNAAECYEALRQFPLAADRMEAAIEADDTAYAHFKLGEIYSCMGRTQDAAGQMDQAIRIAPQFAGERDEILGNWRHFAEAATAIPPATLPAPDTTTTNP